MQINQESDGISSREPMGHAAILVQEHAASVRNMVVHLKLYGPAPHWMLVREQHDNDSGVVHRLILAIPDRLYLLRFLDAEPFLHELRRGYDEILRAITDTR